MCLHDALVLMHVAHLICGDCNEPEQAAIHMAGLQQNVCAIGIIHGERQAVSKGVVHMRLQCMVSCPVMAVR